MATTTNLADRICRLTGLQSTGSERTLILEYLNDAYREAVERSECYPKTSSNISVSAAASSITLSSSITDLNKLRSVYFTGYNGYSYLKLHPISNRNRIDQLDRTNSLTGITRYYSLARSGGTTTMYFHPAPTSAATLVCEYLAQPPTLVESAPGTGEESTPTAIPTQFHYRILAAGGIAMALETDQRRDSQMWWDRFEKGVNDLTAWVNEMPGDGVIEPHFQDSVRLGGTDRSLDLG